MSNEQRRVEESGGDGEEGKCDRDERSELSNKNLR
jgi:hypothetical protein